jgi:hypothetical protein
VLQLAATADPAAVVRALAGVLRTVPTDLRYVVSVIVQQAA